MTKLLSVEDLDYHLTAWIELYQKGNEIDPHDEYTWDGLVVGWALGRGMSIEKAHQFERYVSTTKYI